MKIEDQFTQEIYIKHQRDRTILDPEQILTLVLKCMYELIEVYKGKDLSSVGIVCEHHTAVCYDSETGKAVGDVLMKDDMRTHKTFLNFIGKGPRNLINKYRYKTGSNLKHYHTAYKIHHLIHHDELVQAELAKEDNHLVFSTLDSYILFKLTSVVSTSLSMAASTYLVDILNNPYNYDDELLSILRVNRRYLPPIKCSRYQYGQIRLDLKTSGFYKESQDEAKFKAMREEINNKYIVNYDITQQNLKSIDRDINAEDQQSKNMEKVDCVPHFTEDIPNLYMTNIQNMDDVNIGLRNKIKNMVLRIESILPKNSALLLGHYSTGPLESIVNYDNNLEVFTYLGHEMEVASDIEIETVVCHDYIQSVKEEIEKEVERERILRVQRANCNSRELEEIEETEKNRITPQMRYQTFATNYESKDDPSNSLHQHYTKPSNLRKYWNVTYMKQVTVQNLDKIFDKIVHSFKVCKRPDQLTEMMYQIKLLNDDNLYWIDRLGQSMIFNIAEQHTVYHISKAMLNCISYEAFIALSKVYKDHGLSVFCRDGKESKFYDYSIKLNGRYKSECQYLMEIQADLLNKRLYYLNSTNPYTYLGGSVLFQKSFGDQLYIEDIFSSKSKLYPKYEVFKPHEMILEHKETSNKTEAEIMEIKREKRIQETTKTINNYKKTVNWFYHKSFCYARDFMKFNLEKTQEHKLKMQEQEEEEMKLKKIVDFKVQSRNRNNLNEF